MAVGTSVLFLFFVTWEVSLGFFMTAADSVFVQTDTSFVVVVVFAFVF